MLLNPTGKLSDLKLEDYTILDCEPLHDLKGHLINICKELPYLLKGDVRKSCKDSDKMTCADWVLILQLYLHLHQQKASKIILDLLEIVTRISQILYLPAEERTPHRILQLYNCTWLHYELCKDVSTVACWDDKTRMFGCYLHALAAHAPLQLGDNLPTLCEHWKPGKDFQSS